MDVTELRPLDGARRGVRTQGARRARRVRPAAERQPPGDHRRLPGQPTDWRLHRRPCPSPRPASTAAPPSARATASQSPGCSAPPTCCSPTGDPALAETERLNEQGLRVLLLARVRERRRSTTRPPRTAHGRPPWSSWSSGCGPTPPTPCATSPSRTSSAKVISGDNAVSVGAVAGKLGLAGAEHRRRPPAARRPGRAWPTALDAGHGLRPGHPAAEAGHGGRAPVARPHGRDDRRRRQRRAGPQGRRHRRRDGLGLGGDPGRRADRAARTTASRRCRRWSPRAAG